MSNRLHSIGLYLEGLHDVELVNGLVLMAEKLYHEGEAHTLQQAFALCAIAYRHAGQLALIADCEKETAELMKTIHDRGVANVVDTLNSVESFYARAAHQN